VVQLAARHFPKVKVAGSTPVVRSRGSILAFTGQHATAIALSDAAPLLKNERRAEALPVIANQS
jgi:hypothetical protein